VNNRTRILSLLTTATLLTAACGTAATELAESQVGDPPASIDLDGFSEDARETSTSDVTSDDVIEVPVSDEPNEVASPASSGEAAGFFASLTSGASAILELDFYESVDELVADSDLVVIGKVIDLRRGRVVEFGGSVPALPFAEMMVKDEASGEIVVVEVPFPPSSPALLAALDVAIDREGAASAKTDAEIDRFVDEEAVAQAYADHYDGAIDFTIDEMRSNLPAGRVIFALRLQPETTPGIASGAYRLVNTQGVFVEGEASTLTPLRAEVASEPLGREVAEISFDALVERVRRSGR